MKLQTKITLLSGITSLLLLVLSFFAIDYLYKQLTFNTAYTQLQQRADDFASVVSKLDSLDGIDYIARAYMPTSGGLMITNKANKPLLTLQTTDAQQLDLQAIAAQSLDILTIHDVPAISIHYDIIWPTTHEVVSLQLVQLLPDAARNSTILRWILISLTIAALLPIFIASRLLSRIIVTPIERLTSTMKTNIESASYATIAPPKYSKDEIAQMTHTYNELIQQLQLNFERQQQFVGNASHELRTPLTVIDSYIQLLKRRGVQNEALTQEAVEAIHIQSKTMKTMMEQMLQLAAVREAPTVKAQTVMLTPLLTELQQTFLQAYGRTVHIENTVQQLTIEEGTLKQLLAIFLDNARKYSEGPIFVTVASGSHITITIRDEGIGIPAEDVPHLFERFYRVNKDRGRATGGTGLGLSIASQLAQRIGAKLHIASELDVGTTVTIKLPN